MIKINIKNLSKKTLQHNKTATLLSVAQENHLDWMHACGGKGRCTTCKVNIVEGEANLNNRTNFEEKFFSEDRLKPNQRLACQLEVSGEITIDIPDECKLPHLQYDY